MSKAKKILVLGQVNVGKSTLIKNICSIPLAENELSTIGLSVSSLKLTDTPSIEKLIFWTVGGQSSVSLVQQDILIGTSALIYVFDLTRPSTFQNLDSELALLKERLPGIPTILVGSKKDLIAKDELEDLSTSLKWSNAQLLSGKSELAKHSVLSKLLKVLP